jgi:hypothetical protein
MEGEFRKYSNNDGLTQHNRNTPQAFSHFTYEKSDHQLVIVDIQGVDDWYTDPQIHTQVSFFGTKDYIGDQIK